MKHQFWRRAATDKQCASSVHGTAHSRALGGYLISFRIPQKQPHKINAFLQNQIKPKTHNHLHVYFVFFLYGTML